MNITDAKKFVEEMYKNCIVSEGDPVKCSLYGIAIDTLCKTVDDLEERVAIASPDVIHCKDCENRGTSDCPIEDYNGDACFPWIPSDD